MTVEDLRPCLNFMGIKELLGVEDSGPFQKFREDSSAFSSEQQAGNPSALPSTDLGLVFVKPVSLGAKNRKVHVDQNLFINIPWAQRHVELP